MAKMTKKVMMEMWSNWNPHILIMGLYIGVSALESCLVASTQGDTSRAF